MARSRLFGALAAATPIVGLAVVVGVLVGDAIAVAPAELLGSRFEPALGRLGVLPLVVGTLATTAMAIAVAAPIALVAATWLSELCPSALRAPLRRSVDGLASIPAVAFGVWGRVELVPFVREHFAGGNAPGSGHGFGLLSAALVLAMMSLPSVTAVASHVLSAVPRSVRVTAASLGATRWQALRYAVFPAARRGLWGAVMFGVGRALGEGIAVAMVIGGRPHVPAGWLAPTSTLAVVIVDGQGDATHPDHLAALATCALLVTVLGALSMSVAQRALAATGPTR